MESVAAWLKKGRESKGLKTRAVSSMLKIDQALISKFENGQRRPTKNQITQLAQLFDINIESLTILWIKEKLLTEIQDEPLGIKAFEAAAEQLNLIKPKDNAAIEALFEEMNVLKTKMEALRKP
ncbi:helix-turn-helix transcriptional regulator [Flavobacterium sp. CYK-4]|uniref:helix-turn-helix domain-containing protein n=1 Tax=Flavobacterium lotistagni TaxID=2709660 RepID=UPI00140E1C77|nr:helix-turn-helix transcriptional regulator [Flavobacterium lotistagni]NHM06953.1 helix-turn-helix transcriptional regulator [Flavobacterium lotistagni]